MKQFGTRFVSYKPLLQESYNHIEGELIMKENMYKLGNMDIKKLIIKMSFPAMLSMIVQALYNVVDIMFVAKISE